MELINKDLNFKVLNEITLDMHQGINTVTEKVKYLEKGIPILQSKHITKGYLDLNNSKYLSESDYDKYKGKYQAKIDDILLCNIGTIGSSLRVVKDDEFLIAWNLFLIKINKKFVSSGYLAHYFNYLKSKKYFDRFLTGGTVKFINKKTMQKVPVPLPTLATQKKIAAILDEADKVRQLNKQLIKKYDALTQSLFLEMFGDPVTNPKGWEKVKTIKYSDSIVPGRNKPKSFTGEIPWITTADLVHLGKTKESLKNMGLSMNEISEVRAKIIPKGSVIMTCVGDLGVVTINHIEIIINQQLHAFQCDESLNNIFLMYNLSYQKPYMYKMASSTTVPYMNKTISNNVPTIVPPIQLQNQFAERVQIIENQKQQAQESLQKSEDLFNSLLQKAFKGALVS